LKQILVGYGLIVLVLLALVLLSFFFLFTLCFRFVSILGYGKGWVTSGMETLMTIMNWDLERTLG
jgi:hypothetical protein